MIDNPLVGIIGIKGQYGMFLAELFRQYGCEVIGADAIDGPDTEVRNRSIVERAEVMVFSIPPHEAVNGAISRLIDCSRPEQLWMDVTSLKAAPVQAMLESRAEVVGLHPMCAPTGKSLRGQTVVVCPARLNHWQRWLSDFLRWTGAKVKVTSPEEHDREMAIVQGLIHAAQIMMAATMRALKENFHESLSYASPVYRIALSLIGRILRQDAGLYADIQMLNSNIPEVLSQATNELGKLEEMVKSKNQEEFVRQFEASRNHFGKEELEDAYNLFEELNQLLADRSSEHQALLQVNEDKPGLLHSIIGVFAEADINLTHIHSFQVPDGYRFLVGLDRPWEDLAVQLALRQIEQGGLARNA